MIKTFLLGKNAKTNHHMSITCPARVRHMSVTCPSCVCHMSIMCSSHVRHVFITCLSRVHHMFLSLRAAITSKSWSLRPSQPSTHVWSPFSLSPGLQPAVTFHGPQTSQVLWSLSSLGWPSAEKLHIKGPSTLLNMLWGPNCRGPSCWETAPKNYQGRKSCSAPPSIREELHSSPRIFCPFVS